MPIGDVQRLFTLAGEHLDRSIRDARRDDGLYHSYNRVSFPSADTAHVDHLGPMLEGQVAVLSSGALDPQASLDLIDALFASDMHRADQDTFMLYPVVELPSFLERNMIPAEAVSRLHELLDRTGDPLRRIFTSDADGRRWFRPDLVNEGVLATLLDDTALAQSDRDAIVEIYESTFHHSAFTGRSGSMYGYEGIGSVYWHMVAKLLLAVQEAYWSAVDQGESEDVIARLADAYRRVRSGLGFMKQPGRVRRDPDRLLFAHARSRRRPTAGHDGSGQRRGADPARRARCCG